MNTKKQIILLCEAGVEPTDEILENALGKEIFKVYQELLTIITHEFDLQYEWKFYNDGKTWLLKAIHKKNTIFWLSIWDKFIKTSFYFTEKTRHGISNLEINRECKENFDHAKTIGKLIPLIFDIERKEQLDDFREIVKYKKISSNLKK